MYVYCMFCETQRCKVIAKLMEIRGAMRSFSPQIVRRQRKKGQNLEKQFDLLPGYVFVYSEQPITVTITPANAYYKINWVSDDPSIVSVKGNGTSAIVYSGNKTGVVNVTAIATDSNGAEVRRVCAIQVSSKSNAFDP